MSRDKKFYDYCYEVWRRGGNPDRVTPTEVPDDYDWVYDEPRPKHLPDNRNPESQQHTEQ